MARFSGLLRLERGLSGGDGGTDVPARHPRRSTALPEAVLRAAFCSPAATTGDIQRRGRRHLLAELGVAALVPTSCQAATGSSSAAEAYEALSEVIAGTARGFRGTATGTVNEKGLDELEVVINRLGRDGVEVALGEATIRLKRLYQQVDSTSSAAELKDLLDAPTSVNLRNVLREAMPFLTPASSGSDAIPIIRTFFENLDTSIMLARGGKVERAKSSMKRALASLEAYHKVTAGAPVAA